MKKLFWKFKYAKRLKGLQQITMLDALESAEAALKMVDYDLTECPLDMAYDEYSECAEGTDGVEVL